MLLTRKSSRSNTAPPKMENPSQLHTLYPRTHGNDKRIIPNRFTRLLFFLLHPVSSIIQDIIFSKTASTVENAAKVIKIKNKLPHSLPIGIWLKIFGRVIKIRLGPDVGLTPKVKYAGKMIRPDTIATNVSRIAIFADSPSNDLSFPI